MSASEQGRVTGRLWRCTCGRLNLPSTTWCHRCLTDKGGDTPFGHRTDTLNDAPNEGAA